MALGKVAGARVVTPSSGGGAKPGERLPPALFGLPATTELVLVFVVVIGANDKPWGKALRCAGRVYIGGGEV